MPLRDTSRFHDFEHFAFQSMGEFYSSTIKTGRLEIDYHGSPLDILNIDNRSNTTLIAFHSALSQNMKAIPIFSGVGITSGLDTNLICISDPTLEMNPDLKIAWFLGNERQPLQRDLPSIIAKLLDSNKSQNSVFFGASAGGFAAMYYSSFFPGSLALPLNPQTIVRDFSADSVLSYGRTAFGARSLAESRNYLTRHVTDDLRHVYRGGRGNTIAYVQNAMDTHHLYRHMAPFLSTSPMSPWIHALVEDWGVGHVPPPKEIVRNIVEASIRCGGSWGQMLSDLGFVNAPQASFPSAQRKILRSGLRT